MSGRERASRRRGLALGLLAALAGLGLAVGIQAWSLRASDSATSEPVAQEVTEAQAAPAQDISGAYAAVLLTSRWACSGDGCLDDNDIARLARMVVAKSSERDIPAAIVFGVIMVENPWLDSTAVSYAGARGVMQVMTMHDGTWGCREAPETVAGNLCLGLSVLEFLLASEARKAVSRALLRYNGCTPAKHGCDGYADKVYSAVPDA